MHPTIETRALARCPGCGALFPAVDGPTHAYLGASPGCWAIYGEVLAREYSDYRFARFHGLTVDAYAVQHPGAPERRSIQSVAVHLIGLYLAIERADLERDRSRALQLAADRGDAYRWLEPPRSLGDVTVRDVHAAGDDAPRHLETVRRWADSTWQAWEPHHASVRKWASALFTMFVALSLLLPSGASGQDASDDNPLLNAPIRPAVYRGQVLDADEQPLGTIQLGIMSRTDTSFGAYVMTSSPAAPAGDAYGWFEDGEALSILTISAREDTTIWRSSSAGSELEGEWEVVGGPSAGTWGTWTAKLEVGRALAAAGQRGQFIPPAPVPEAWFAFALVIGAAIAFAVWVSRAPRIAAPVAANPVELELSGVGGWMMLFLIGQSIVLLVGLAQTSTLLADLESLPFGDVLPAFTPLLVMETAVGLAQLVLVPIGIVLTARKWPGTPRFWFAYLGFFLLYAVVDLLAVRDLHVQMGRLYGPIVEAETEKATSDAMRQHVRTMFYAPLWMTYWVRSRRVAMTFGAGAGGARPAPQGIVRISPAAPPPRPPLATPGSET